DLSLELTRQIGSALQKTHSVQVVHRDLKADNIMVVPYLCGGAERLSAKLIDFSIAKLPRAVDEATANPALLGTPEYISPAAARGQNMELAARAAQWSFAVVLYFMLTGELPFRGRDLVETLLQIVSAQPPSVRALAPHVPERIEHAIFRALSKQPKD